MQRTDAPADEGVVGQIEDFLQEAILEMEREGLAEPERGRPRILPSLCLWAGLLVCILRGFSSQLALWRLLRSGDFWFYPRFEVSDQAVYKRLAQADSAPLERLFGQISALLAMRLAPYTDQSLAPFAKEVVALDESTLDAVAQMLPALRQLPKGDPGLLPGKLTGLFDLRRQQWVQVEHQADPQQNEKLAARGMLEHLPQGSLLLADLGYFGFAWFDALSARGYHWLSRLRHKTSYTILHRFYQQGDTLDALVWLGAYRADKAAHAVRLVQFRQGGTLRRYLTNVLDPQLFPLTEVAKLYARRWDIELAFKLIKQQLKLHLLWSAKPQVVLQQIWGVLIIAQILQALRLEIAGKAGVEPFEVSMALLVQYLPQYAYSGKDPIALFVERGRDLGFIRPSRRTAIKAPYIDPADLSLPPPDLVLTREPRYAGRKCHREEM